MTEDQTVICVEHVTKVYKLYRSRQDRLQEWLLPMNKKRHTEHFALRDISFTVQKGDIVGVIGKNGSGKSTLLKILAGVVTPNQGLVECKGTVTALLELGAGFNTELTGVENLYYLGAVQGVSRGEMRQKVDEILAFADIGEYAWQPVKNYSSGMYVRLAFSLSIHINPEILIIDEALSVGDVRFQQKCFRKIRQFKDTGKTIIFCSHSMQAVRDFCTKVLWIHEGEIREAGHPDSVTEQYTLFMTAGNKEQIHLSQPQSSISHADKTILHEKWPHMPWIDISGTEQYGRNNGTISGVAAQDKAAKFLSFSEAGAEVQITLLVETEVSLPECDILISLHNPLGAKIASLSSHLYGSTLRLSPGKRHLIQSRFRLPDVPNGQYSLGVGLRSFQDEVWDMQHFIHDALFFTIQTNDRRFHTNAALVIRDADFVHEELS